MPPLVRVDVLLDSRPLRKVWSETSRVEAVSDSVTEERIAQVGFERLPTGLSVGELAEVTLALAPTAPMLLLPNAAIKRVGDQTGVWWVDGQRLRGRTELVNGAVIEMGRTRIVFRLVAPRRNRKNV